MDPCSELAARERIEAKRLRVVGWYHSHPVFPAEPSVRDIENQENYQRLFKEGKAEPFVGVIVAPYETKQPMKDTSQMRCFWISQDERKQRQQYSTPMATDFELSRTPNFSTELIDELFALLTYYEVYPSRVDMSSRWRRDGWTKRDKLKSSLIRPLPLSLQGEYATSFLDKLCEMLCRMW